MPVVDGSQQLRALGLRLKAAGASGLRLELMRGLRAGAKPLIPLVQQAAIDQLPRTGGLNQQVASQKVSVNVRLGSAARGATVRLTTKAPDTQQTDSGFVRHPTFGRRGKGEWRTQQIPKAAGWWSVTLANSGSVVTPELLAVMERVTLAINRGL